MKLVPIARIAFQWRVHLDSKMDLPLIKAISADYIEFEVPVTHAMLTRFGPGQFALRVSRSENRIHSPKSWRPLEQSVGRTAKVILEWECAASRSAFMRDLLLARQSELFSPAGV